MFKDPFTYNNSGIVLEYSGATYAKEEVGLPFSSVLRSENINKTNTIQNYVGYRLIMKPIYKIVEIRKSSNAYATGLRRGDILISINGKKAYNFNLSEINEIFHDKTGRRVSLKVDRNGEIILYKFKLDNAFKKEEHSN